MGRARVSDTLIDSTGRPVGNATITVYDFGTTTPAADILYAGATGGTLFSGVTDSETGFFEFWVDTPDRFSVLLESPLTSPVTRTYEAVLDPDEEIHTTGTQTRGSGLTMQGATLIEPSIEDGLFTGGVWNTPELHDGSWENPSLVGSVALEDVTVTGEAGVRGDFRAYGDYAVTGNHYSGLQVAYDPDNPYMVIPWVGMIESGGDSPWNGGAPGRSWVQISRANTSRINEILTDVQFTTYNQGEVAGTGTVGSSTSTTITGTGFDVAWINKNLGVKTGTGAAQVRRISNVNGAGTLITVDRAWTVNPGAGATFDVVSSGDEAATKIIARVKGGASPGNGLLYGASTWGRCAEWHITREAESGNASISAFHLGIHNDTPASSTDEVVGILMMSEANSDFLVGYPTGIGWLAAGDRGYAKFFEGRSAANAVVADWDGAGSLWANDLRMTQVGASTDPGAGKTRLVALSDGRFWRTPGGAATSYRMAENREIMGKNLLINGDGRVWSRGVTAPTATDNAYASDRWRLLLGAATAATVNREATTVPSDGGKLGVALTVGAANNNKFGYWQVIEGLNVVDLRGKKVSLQAKLQATAGLSDIRMAVVEFTGTIDTGVSGDPISAWNSTGTNPTLAANYTYLNTPANLSVGTTFSTFKAEGITVGASANNLAVFIWCDDTTSTTTTDVLRIFDVQLEEGDICTAFERRPRDVELALCERYYWKSFPVNTAPAQSAGITAAISDITPSTTSYHTRAWVTFPSRMRKTPTIVTYNPYAANTGWGDASTAGDPTVGAAIGASGETGFLVYGSSGTPVAAHIFAIHATADAEL